MTLFNKRNKPFFILWIRKIYSFHNSSCGMPIRVETTKQSPYNQKNAKLKSWEEAETKSMNQHIHIF